MPSYRYTAVDTQGHPVSGCLDADSVEQASEQLRDRGLEPLTVCPAVEEKAASGSEKHTSARLSGNELANVAAEISDLTGAGLPLSDGLRAAAAELGGTQTPAVLRTLADELDRGVPLPEAIDSLGSRVPSDLAGLLRAGAQSDRIGEVLEVFLDLRRQHAQLRRRVRIALAYPALLLTMLLGLFWFFSAFVVREFETIFTDFDAELPNITEMLFWWVHQGFPPFAGVLLLFLATTALALTMPLKGWAGRLLTVIPVLGPMNDNVRLTVFARLMSCLLEQSTHLPDALRLAADGLHGTPLAAGCQRAAADVERGRTLAHAMAANRCFPRALVPIVAWGEQIGALPDAFRTAAEMYDGRAKIQAGLFEVIAPPLTFLIILAGVFLLVMGLMAPLISLIQKLT